MSTVVSKNVQIGADGTASNNFTAYQPAAPDGTLRIGNGNSGSVTDAITLTSAGNVGIGTASPSSYASTTLEISGSSASSDLKMTNTTTGTGDAAGFDLELNGSDINYVNRTASGNQKFWTNSTERMRITSAGNVGIGTSSFSQKLSVSSSATDVTAINLVNTSSGGGNYNIGAVGSAGWVGGSAGSLVIRDSLVGATRVVLDSSGNLGLGNTPSATSAAGYTAFELGTSAGTGLTGNNGDLYVSENAYVSGGAWKYAASSIASAQYNLGGGVHRWFNAAAGTANNNITWTQAMTLTAAGNLGIGTSSPNAKLELGGTNPNMYFGPVATGSGGYLSYNTSGNYFAINAVTQGVGYRNIALANDGGNVGIGTSSPSEKLTVNGSINLPTINTWVRGAGHNVLQVDATRTYFYGGTNGVQFRTADNVSALVDITNAGNLLVGTTSSSISNTAGSRFIDSGRTLNIVNTGAVYPSIITNQVGYGGKTISFRYTDSEKGYIETTSTNVIYSTTSDYRLKNTIAPMTGALDKVALLKPVTYKWNEDGSDGQGFIAHELAEVMPDCVTGTKDAVDENGNPKYQGIDTSFLVATLTAALQEALAEINALKARLDAANL